MRLEAVVLLVVVLAGMAGYVLGRGFPRAPELVPCEDLRIYDENGQEVFDDVHRILRNGPRR